MAKGIYKRGKVYWIRYAGLDGKITFESSHSEKFDAAETLLLNRKNAVKEGKQPEARSIKPHLFKELAAEYLKWAERQRSYSKKKSIVNYLVTVFGPYPLRKFTTKLLEQYQTAQLKDGNRRGKKKEGEVKGNKPATINRHLATIKHMFTKAEEWGMVAEGTLKAVRKVKLLPENNRRLRYLSCDECQRLLDACEPHLRPIVTVALNTGMRKGEILGLTWDRVDLRHGFILLDKTKSGDRREIPINDTLTATLKGLTRRVDVPHVFYDPKTGKPYTTIQRSFNTAAGRAKLADFKFHDLRHTFASHLVMAGIDLTTVRELLGHRDLTMTLRYAHLAPAHKVKAVGVLDKALNSANYTKTIQSKGDTGRLKLVSS